MAIEHGRTVTFLVGISTLALTGAAYMRAESNRPYRFVPHVSFESAVIDPETARREGERVSQRACDRASKDILPQFGDNDSSYAQGYLGWDEFADRQHSLSAELLTKCEGAPRIPREAYTEDPTVIYVLGSSEESDH